MEVEVTEIVDRPIAEVWDFCVVNHARNHPRWDPDIELEQETDGPIGPGTVFKRWSTRYETPTVGTMEVIEFLPERLMTTRIQDGPILINGRFVVSAIGSGKTELTLGAEFPGLEESMAEKIRPLMERSAQNIKRLIESS